MLNLLKSDIYKIFKRTSFYVYLILSIISAGYSTWIKEQSIKNQMKSQYTRCASFVNVDDVYAQIDGMKGSDLGLSAWAVVVNNLPTVLTCAAIFLTIFISSEFSSGMCKNVLIRGKNRISFYFSKLLSCSLVSIIYSIAVCGINFAIGAYKWQGCDWKNEYIGKYLIPLGWFVLVALTWQAILCMTSFLCRNSGVSMGINLGLVVGLVPSAILLGLEYISKNWFNLTDVDYGAYWIGSYDGISTAGMHSATLQSEVLVPLIWTISCWFVLSTVLGILFFQRKEIK